MNDSRAVVFLVLLSALVLLASCAGAPEAAKASAKAAETMEEEASAMTSMTAKAKEEAAPPSEAPAPAEPVSAGAISDKEIADSVPEAPSQVATAQGSGDERSQLRADQPTTRYLSADDSNSAASPVIARRLIASGRYVQPALVRTYEFLNYFTFGYPAPYEAPVAIYPQMRPAEAAGEYSLQVAVRSRDRSLAEVAPLNLTILIDVSGSMAGEPIALARNLVNGIASRLRPGDLLSLLSCAHNAKILLEKHRVGGETSGLVAGLLAGLRPDDVTDLGQGVKLAYTVATRTYDYRFLNRVVVVSDGADNVSPEAEATIARNAEDSDRQGIYLAGIGVGEGFNDQLMNRFTDKGRGAYLFVDSAAEVDRLLTEASLASVFDLAVKNVRLKMVMPPGWRMTEFHGEQVSARAADVVPQYLASNDQMIYHLVVATEKPAAEA